MRACQLSSPQSSATGANRDSWQLAGESSPAPLVASQGEQDQRNNQQAANNHPFERSIPVLATSFERKLLHWLLRISVLKIGATKDNINISPDQPCPHTFFHIYSILILHPISH